MDSLGSFKRMVISSVNSYNLTSSSPICVYFFLLPITLVVFLSTIIREKMKESCVSFLGLHETVFAFPLCVTLAIGPSYLSLITLRYHPSVSALFIVFNHKGVLPFVKDLLWHSAAVPALLPSLLRLNSLCWFLSSCVVCSLTYW